MTTINTSGFIPLDVRVVVLPDDVEKVTKGGIILADAAVERKEYATTDATMIALGSNAFADWGAAANKPAPGTRCLIAKYAGGSSIFDGEDGRKYRICNDSDILAIRTGAEHE